MPLGAGFAQGFLQTLQQGQQQALENARAQQELEQRKELQKLQAAILKGQEAKMQLEAAREQAGQAKRRRLLELLTTQGAEHPETKSAALALSLSEGKDPFATLQGLGDQRLFEQFLQQREAPQGETPAPPAPAPTPQPAPVVAPQSRSVPAGPLQQQIVAEAQRQGVPPALALSVAAIESNFTPGAIGDNGRSHGIFQLQPPAALEVGVDPARRLAPAENIRGGVAYLKKKLAQSGGDPIQAGVLYNGGGDPQYAAKLQRAYVQYGGQPSQEQAGTVALPEAPQPDPAYQALDAQQRKALQDVQELTALQVRLTPGSPVAQKVETLIDNARQLASSLETQKKSTEYGRSLDVREKATVAAYQGAVGAQIAATRASETEQGKIRGEQLAKEQQTLAEAVGADKASHYYNTTLGEEVPPDTPYPQIKRGQTPGGDRIVYLSEARLKARDDIESIVPVLQRMGDLTRKIYGPGGIFANLAPSGRLDAAAQGLWARLTQTDPDLKELESLVTANIENIGRTLRGVRGAGTEGDVRRQLEALPKVQGVPDTKEVATRLYNALANAANIHYRAIFRNKDYIRPGLELLFTEQEEKLINKYAPQR